MDKSEILKQIKQYAFTFVVQLKYREDERAQIDYFCSDSDIDLAFKIEDSFGIEEGDKYEIIYEMSNDFNSDDFLSDSIIQQLEGSCAIEDEDYAKYSVGYISVLYNECCYTDEGKQYKKDILKSVLKYMDLRKQKPITLHVINELFKIFGREKDSKLNYRKQIELILDPTINGDILYKLAKKEFAKVVGNHLDKIGSAYKIQEEKSQYRRGVLFLKLFDYLNESHFLLPKFSYEDGAIRNYTTYMQLMASYYGFKNPPTYREGVLKRYKETGKKSALYDIIRNEHMDVWLGFTKVV